MLCHYFFCFNDTATTEIYTYVHNRFLHDALPILIAIIGVVQPALAQKSGGIFKIYHRDSPPSMSIHEEATNSTFQPMMNVMNNLVIFDQLKPINSLDTIVPEDRKSVV